ncbi:hypothetical protein BHM03_00018391 [Ensete ventricosum]|nr:hypothetical protein BHM03_00018391 [Ensete ventricosum]
MARAAAYKEQPHGQGCHLQGRSLVGAITSKGSARVGGACGHNAHKHGQHYGRSLWAWHLLIGATARGQWRPPAGKGSHRLRRGGGNGS